MNLLFKFFSSISLYSNINIFILYFHIPSYSHIYIYIIIWKAIFRIRALKLKVGGVNIVYILNDIKYIKLQKVKVNLKFT